MFPDQKELSPFYHNEFPDLEEIRKPKEPLMRWEHYVIGFLCGLFTFAVYIGLLIYLLFKLEIL